MNPLDLIVTIIWLIADLPKSIRHCPNLFLAIQSPDVKGVNIGRKKEAVHLLIGSWPALPSKNAGYAEFTYRSPLQLELCGES